MARSTASLAFETLRASAMVKASEPLKPVPVISENMSSGFFFTLPTALAASSAAFSMAEAVRVRSSPFVVTTTGRPVWLGGGSCTRAVLLMMELGMMISSPAEFLMVVWRHVTSRTTPDSLPTVMLSPGLMMRSRLSCKPPIRLDRVS